MRNTFLPFAACLVLAAPFPAFAQNEAALCRLLPKTQDGNAASAAYVPGVDVHGAPVVPADLDNSMVQAGEGPFFDGAIRIPVTIDLIAALEQPLPGNMEAKASAAVIDIYKDGRVFMNGADVTGKAHLLCAGDPVSLTEKGTPPAEQDTTKGEGQKE